MLCASGLILLLAYTSTVSPDETLALRLLAAGCVIVTLLLWLQWRYAFYCIALIWIGILVGFLFLYRDHSTISSWFFRIAYPLSFLISAYQIVHKGRPYAITRGNGWETERAQVEWLLESRIDPEGRPFLYIPTGSFWTGYFTYALGNLGEFRAVMQFKTGTDRLADFRILNKDAVRIVETTKGKMFLELEGKSKHIDESPELRKEISRLGLEFLSAQ